MRSYQEVQIQPYRVLAIDPGTDTMGISLFELPHLGPIQVVYSHTFRATPYLKYHEDVIACKGARIARLEIHAINLRKLFRHFNPHAIAVETPFMHRFPEAYAALVECFNMIRDVAYEFNPSMRLIHVSPMEAKKSIGARIAKGTKDDVRNAVLALKDVQWIGVDPLGLDEHAMDSVAVGYCFCKSM